jgi:hypothetical protein
MEYRKSRRSLTLSHQDVLPVPSTAHQYPRSVIAAPSTDHVTLTPRPGEHGRRDEGVFIPGFGLVVTSQDIEHLLVLAQPECYYD